MREATVRVSNRLGLHARAAAKIVHLAKTFTSSLTISRAEDQVAADAKSVLEILAISAACGSELRIAADGPDECTAIERIVELFDEGFGES